MVERDVKKPLCKVTAGKGLGYCWVTLTPYIGLMAPFPYSDASHFLLPSVYTIGARAEKG